MSMTSETTRSPGAGAEHGAGKQHPHAMSTHDIPHDLKKPRTLTVVAVAILFVLLLAGLFVLGWLPYLAEQRDAAKLVSDGAGDIPLVQAIAPVLAEGRHELVLPCDIKPSQETALYPRTSGYLKKLYVDIQDTVTAGQLLAEIDTPEVDAQLLQSKAAVEQTQAAVVKAQADLDLAQRTLDRYQGSAAGVVTKQEMDVRVAAKDQAAAAVEQSKADVRAAQANVERLIVLQGFEKVTAPFAGTITARNYDVGSLLSSNSSENRRELFHITQTDVMRVYVNVPQIEATDLAPGQQAFLTVQNYPMRKFEGTIARSTNVMDSTTRTMMYELHFLNAEKALRSGMYGEVRIEVKENVKVLLVPGSALVFDALGSRVALTQDGRIHMQEVVVGRDLGTKTEILSGLKESDMVVTNPGPRLVDGMAVQVKDPEKVAATQKVEK